MPRAIGVLTAWLEGGGARDPDAELVWMEIMANVEEGTEAEVEMTLGLFKLSSVLLIRLAAAEGRPAADILQDVARRYTS